MSAVFDEFRNLITSKKNYRSGGGWTNINCPACGDKRQRGGFKATESGGFRYFCFNGGCEFNSNATGWEPGNGLFGRVRYLFQLLGGNIKDIPFEEIAPDKVQRKEPIKEEDRYVIKFDTSELPEGCILLKDAAQKDNRAKEVYDFVENKGSIYMNHHPFMWTKLHPYYYIIPYIHYKNQIVGYLGRNIKPIGVQDRFIQRSAPDYMFNQHLLTLMDSKYAFVVESPMDAIPIFGLGSRGSKLTQKQINLLKNGEKDPVLIPDHRGKEWTGFLDAAKQHNWYVSVPEWGHGIKDSGESIKKNGLLYTIETITNGMTKNYLEAEVKLRAYGSNI